MTRLLLAVLLAGAAPAILFAQQPDTARVPAKLEPVKVSATRAERRVEDTPLRVEVVDEEEVAEKVAMTPGDVSMLLNETSGLRVQVTSPSLGGAGVRVQGLRGRYTLLLADGLPLHGGQSGGLGLLQIPPMDLARVEVIKGSASALYGSSALGGVINFVSRRPEREPIRELLLNQTTRGGSDAVAFLATSRSRERPWSATLLASGHHQRENDIDGDGWADMPGYDRLVLRPRLFVDDRAGRSLFATVGVTAEDRKGGTLEGRVTPDGDSFVEALRTRRADGGIVARTLLGGRDLLAARLSLTDQRHRHRFGERRERDAHRTGFGELSLTAPRGRWTLVGGAAFQGERYRNDDLPAFDYAHRAPGIFGQADVDVTPWVVLSGSARTDWHNVHGAIVSPRASLLLRAPDGAALGGWTTRLSAGGGAFAPTPFTEETEATGLAQVAPPVALRLERAVGGSLDVGGPVKTAFGRLELNGTLFGSRLAHPVMVRSGGPPGPADEPRLELVNAPLATNSWGAEALVRLLREPFRVTASYAYTRAREWDPESASEARREAPLVPRHTAGIVASLEEEDSHRIGVELYYTGRQALDRNPYRAESRPYLVFGVLAERTIPVGSGSARVFVNAENLLDVRQTRVDPLLLPIRGPGGRRTTDAWSLLEGRTFNVGVRFRAG